MKFWIASRLLTYERYIVAVWLMRESKENLKLPNAVDTWINIERAYITIHPFALLHVNKFENFRATVQRIHRLIKDYGTLYDFVDNSGKKRNTLHLILQA